MKTGRPSKYLNLRGSKFNFLTAIERAPGNSEAGNVTYLWECDCGKFITASASDVVRGHTQSCGCFQKERASQAKTTHGKSQAKIYSVWSSMKGRCNNPQPQDAAHYRDRGIRVCDEWQDNFETFYNWAVSHGYREGLSIDRIDNDGNYCPKNCRWATNYVQQNNKSTNVTLCYDGETKTLSQWAEEMGISRRTLYRRLKSRGGVELVISKNSKGGKISA